MIQCECSYALLAEDVTWTSFLKRLVRNRNKTKMHVRAATQRHTTLLQRWGLLPTSGHVMRTHMIGLVSSFSLKLWISLLILFLTPAMWNPVIMEWTIIFSNTPRASLMRLLLWSLLWSKHQVVACLNRRCVQCTLSPFAFTWVKETVGPTKRETLKFRHSEVTRLLPWGYCVVEFSLISG